MKRTADDRRFSLAIRARDHFTCQRCGAVHLPTSQGLHSAHCFGRGKPATRLDPDNAAALCYGCHSFLDSHPEDKHAWFRARLGDERYEALQLRSNRTNRSLTQHNRGQGGRMTCASDAPRHFCMCICECANEATTPDGFCRWCDVKRGTPHD